MYQWLVFAHILGVFGFLLAHGTSAAVAFKLKGEREVERVCVLLDLSRGSGVVANLSLLALLAAGIAAGFMGHWWGHAWIWTALVVLILLGVAMTLVGSGPLNRIRQLVQPDEPSHRRAHSKSASQSDPVASADQQLAILLAATHPLLITAIGGGGLALILWLMMFKPF